MRMKLEEWLAEVKRLLAIKRWNYTHKPDAWFFPSDVAPHSAQFKYRCKKLYEAGLLERHGDSKERWGYQYRIKPQVQTTKESK